MGGSRLWEMGNEYKILVEYPEKKIAFERSRFRREDNIKIYLRERRCVQ
jgi:hypothetical protein